MKNVFTKDWTKKDGEQAWRLSNEIYEAALREDYKNLDIEQFFSIFKNKTRNEYGFFDIAPNKNVPSDGTVDFWYVPTYAIIAIYVWFKNQNSSGLDEKIDLEMAALMELAFKTGIVGHGYEAPEMMYKTMLIFAKAGVKEFIEREPEFSSVFTEEMLSYYDILNKELVDAEKTTDRSYFGWLPKRNDLLYFINAWNGRKNAIFVYGTLMAGEGAAAKLDSYEYCGNFILKDYAMYKVSSFPGIKEKTGESVQGEVYFVDDTCIEQLDSYEGEGLLYTRTRVRVKSEWGDLDAITYVYNHEVNGYPVRSKWHVKPDDEVWYACYGSNLSSERFRVYIEGGYFELNKKSYLGCSNKNLWKATDFKSFSGQLYFGNKSGSWFDTGVAFFDPDADSRTYMRLYKITWGQLKEIQAQEGKGDNWYGREICLGIHEDGCSIYTLTSENRREENKPHEVYVNLIKEALINECGMDEKRVRKYLGRWQK